MRLWLLKRRLSSISLRPRISRGRKKLITAVAVILIVIILFAVIFSRIMPLIIKVAEAETRVAVTKIINRTVADIIKSGELDYESLIILEKDQSGNITALVTNMAKINTLQADVSTAVLAELSKYDSSIVRIPIGNIIGGPIFMGRGFRIPVKIVSFTSINTAFKNEFTSAGINQTRHRIMLDMNISLGMLIPGYSSTITVTTQISVAETVIVGGVPDTYAQIK